MADKGSLPHHKGEETTISQLESIPFSSQIRDAQNAFMPLRVQHPYYAGLTSNGINYIDTNPINNNNDTIYGYYQFSGTDPTLHSLSPTTWPVQPISGEENTHRGITVVLAHGFSQGLCMWSENIDAIAALPGVNRVIAFDWPGMGGSVRETVHAPARDPLSLFYDDYFALHLPIFIPPEKETKKKKSSSSDDSPNPTSPNEIEYNPDMLQKQIDEVNFFIQHNDLFGTLSLPNRDQYHPSIPSEYTTKYNGISLASAFQFVKSFIYQPSSTLVAVETLSDPSSAAEIGAETAEANPVSSATSVTPAVTDLSHSSVPTHSDTDKSYFLRTFPSLTTSFPSFTDTIYSVENWLARCYRGEQSDYMDEQQAIDFFTAPVVPMWDELSIMSQPVVLVGHSLGGYLSAQFAHRYPGLVQSLVLASPAGISRGMGLIHTEQDKKEKTEHLLNLLVGTAAVRQLLPSQSSSPSEESSIVVESTNQNEFPEASSDSSSPVSTATVPPAFPQISSLPHIQFPAASPYNLLPDDLHPALAFRVIQNTFWSTIMTLWRWGVTPQGIMRGVPNFIQDRVAHAVLNRMHRPDVSPLTEEDSDALEHWVKLILTAPPVGEHAMNSVLYADYPLLDYVSPRDQDQLLALASKSEFQKKINIAHGYPTEDDKQSERDQTSLLGTSLDDIDTQNQDEQRFMRQSFPANPSTYAREPLKDILAELPMPTTLIYGDNDWLLQHDVPFIVADIAQQQINYQQQHKQQQQSNVFDEQQQQQQIESSGVSSVASLAWSESVQGNPLGFSAKTTAAGPIVVSSLNSNSTIPTEAIYRSFNGIDTQLDGLIDIPVADKEYVSSLLSLNTPNISLQLVPQAGHHLYSNNISAFNDAVGQAVDNFRLEVLTPTKQRYGLDFDDSYSKQLVQSYIQRSAQRQRAYQETSTAPFKNIPDPAQVQLQRQLHRQQSHYGPTAATVTVVPPISLRHNPREYLDELSHKMITGVNLTRDAAVHFIETTKVAVEEGQYIEKAQALGLSLAEQCLDGVSFLLAPPVLQKQVVDTQIKVIKQTAQHVKDVVQSVPGDIKAVFSPPSIESLGIEQFSSTVSSLSHLPLWDELSSQAKTELAAKLHQLQREIDIEFSTVQHTTQQEAQALLQSIPERIIALVRQQQYRRSPLQVNGDISTLYWAKSYPLSDISSDGVLDTLLTSAQIVLPVSEDIDDASLLPDVFLQSDSSPISSLTAFSYVSSLPSQSPQPNQFADEQLTTLLQKQIAKISQDTSRLWKHTQQQQQQQQQQHAGEQNPDSPATTTNHIALPFPSASAAPANVTLAVNDDGQTQYIQQSIRPVTQQQPQQQSTQQPTKSGLSPKEQLSQDTQSALDKFHHSNDVLVEDMKSKFQNRVAFISSFCSQYFPSFSKPKTVTGDISPIDAAPFTPSLQLEAKLYGIQPFFALQQQEMLDDNAYFTHEVDFHF